ncbi:4'-phosphopantetheinyl transferase superfamily protein [Actinosynnema sp. NPDC050436]|uniref:4'-phosphopantetheinyl transferase family protein n=1 Tax=Actinosynnema sp. NPDC050436 TaxID=3155659 RepID=UPI0033EA6385
MSQEPTAPSPVAAHPRLLSVITPPGVAAAELFEDPPGLFCHPAELAQVERAVAKRRNEYISVRHCARVALSALGHESAVILKDADGAPVWPQGAVGSLTHCAGYRGAVAAPAGLVRGMGIDAEPNVPLPDDVLPAVSLPPERAFIAGATVSGVHWDKLLFSAKESIFKTWFPLTRRWLGFDQAEISFTAEAADRGTFDATILVDGTTTDDGPPLTHLSGRWTATRDLLVTSIVLLR